MGASNFLTVKDYLFYYISGFFWMLDFTVLSLLFSKHSRLIHSLKDVKYFLDLINPVLLAVLLIIIPYVLGFALSPIGNFATKQLRMRFGDPRNLVVDYTSNRYKGKRIRKSTIKLIVKKLRDSLGEDARVTDDNLHTWFFQIRAFVIQASGGASDLANRAQELANVSESLMLPLPLFFILLGVMFWSSQSITSIALFISGLVVFYLLAHRYLHLRDFWARHVYRAFLVIDKD